MSWCGTSGYCETRFARCGRKTTFTINAIVILPDHFHAVWTLPDGDADYSGRWQAIKSHFTRETGRVGTCFSCPRCTNAVMLNGGQYCLPTLHLLLIMKTEVL